MIAHSYLSLFEVFAAYMIISKLLQDQLKLSNFVFNYIILKFYIFKTAIKQLGLSCRYR